MRLWFFCAAALAAISGVASADTVPTTMSFVARLADSGVPVTGAHDLQLELFDAATAGTSKWLETHDNTVVPADGVLFLVLGGTVPLDAGVFDGGPRFLEITIDGTKSSTRIPIGSAPYAVRAGVCANADRLQSHPATDFQVRIASACGSGQSIQTINQDGSVTCETDQDTKFTAGAGLQLVGNAFNVDTSVIQARVGSCTPGHYIRAVDSAGLVTCDVDANTVLTAGAGITIVNNQIAVDPTAIQARVATACLAGQAIQAVDATGGVTCEPNISNQSAVAQAAALFISGAVRTTDLVRAGVESSNTDLPTTNLAAYDGVVDRRIVSKTTTAGSVIARTDLIALARGAAATDLAVTFATNLPSAASVECYGVDTSGNSVGAALALSIGESCAPAAKCSQTLAFGGSVVPSALTCILGGLGHTTTVTMHRSGSVWTGFATSTFNQ